jgi:hypothetical protein
MPTRKGGGHRDAAAPLFSEERQAAFYEGQGAALERADDVRGLAAWLLHDFRSLRRLMRTQGGFNRKGASAEDKATRKLGFEVLSACFRRLRAARAAIPPAWVPPGHARPRGHPKTCRRSIAHRHIC